jgi:hypothetical protein
MLFHDTVTGQLHEVPDHALAEDPQGSSGYGEGQVIYDGLGNPLGLWFLPKIALAAKALAPLAAKAIPAVAKFLPKIAGKILPKVTRFLPNVTRFLPRIPQLIQRGMNIVQRLPFQPRFPLPMPMPAAPMPMPSLPEPSMMPEPEQEMGEMVYDGLGNPVGFVPSFSFRAPGVSFRPPSFSFRPPGLSVTPPGVSVGPARPIMGGFHILQRLRAALAQARAQGQAPNPALVARYQQMLSWYRRMRAMRGGRIPPGWMRRPVPYTGLGPNRLYMRCATWPGPAGLVPASAATAAAAAAAAPGGRRRRRRRRR